MTAGTTQDPVETALRDLFAARRAAPSEDFRERLASIPVALGVPARTTNSTVFQLTAAAVAIAAVIALAVFTVQLTGPTSSAADPGPAEGAFDPYMIGPGVIGAEPASTLPVVPWLIGAMAAGGLVLLARRRGRRVQLAAVALIPVLGIGAYGVATHPGPVWANAYGAELGTEIIDTPNPFEGRDVAQVTAEPGEPFSIAFNIRNPGILPVEVLGIAHGPAPGQAIDWSALWMDPEGWPGFRAIDESRPFQPIQLAPEQVLNLYLVGRAGTCSAHPDQSAGTAASRDSIQVAYRVLGLTGVEWMELPVIVVEYQQGDCSG